MIVSASLAACVAGLVEFAIPIILTQLKVSRLSAEIENAVLAGAITGMFVWALLVMFSWRRRYMRTKLQVVAELNHELRNALEVILHSGYLPDGQRYPALLSSAERIDKALEELLPEKHVSAGIRQ